LLDEYILNAVDNKEIKVPIITQGLSYRWKTKIIVFFEKTGF
jgi:hypothetical protein